VNFKRKSLTPLCFAITSGNLEIVELLLDAKASTQIAIPKTMIPAVTKVPMKDILSALLKAHFPRKVRRKASFIDDEFSVFDLAMYFAEDHKTTKKLMAEARFNMYHI